MIPKVASHSYLCFQYHKLTVEFARNCYNIYFFNTIANVADI